MTPARWLVAAPPAIALWLGCAGRAQPPQEAPNMQTELEIMGGYPAGSDPVYAELAERETAGFDAFDRAVEAYAAGRALDAARGFMAAAAVIGDRPDQPLREVFAANRRICYSNAQRAFQRAAALSQGRAALSEAAVGDPANAAAIHGLLALLSP